MLFRLLLASASSCACSISASASLIQSPTAESSRAVLSEMIPLPSNIWIVSNVSCSSSSTISHLETDLPPPVLPSGPLTRARDVLAVSLDGDHHALFGPHGNGGVVVVNEAGQSL